MMTPCNVLGTDRPNGAHDPVPCNLAQGHPGPHSWETEKQFLDRTCPPDPVRVLKKILNRGGHDIRHSDSSLYDEKCARCGMTNVGDLYTKDCPVPVRLAATAQPAAPVPDDYHYRARGGIQPIDFIRTNHLDFLEGNVVKYVHRWRAKNGLEDLRKARFYIDQLIAEAEDEERKREGDRHDEGEA